LTEAFASQPSTTWSNSVALLLTVKSNSIRHDGEFKHGAEGQPLALEVGALTATADSADRTEAFSSSSVVTTSSQASSWDGVAHGNISKSGHSVVADSKQLNADARASLAGNCACATTGATMGTGKDLRLSGMIDMCVCKIFESGRRFSIIEMKREDTFSRHMARKFIQQFIDHL